VLPISRRPIRDGTVSIKGSKITSTGTWRSLSPSERKSALDLGDCVVLPGLVNAHCHLDYTDMAGEFTSPRLFSDWIKQITTLKSLWGYSEFAASWLNGARMLLQTGTTTVGDIEAIPELLPEVWTSVPLRVFSFLEMTGIRSRRQPARILEEAVERIDALEDGRSRAWLSPHAPYSTMPELLQLSAKTARRRGWRLCTHVSESAEEFEMFTRGRGDLFEWLRRNDRDMSDCGLGSPVRHLARNGMLADNLLAVHANYLARKDTSLLASHRVSVVHCPRSHDFFGHAPFPLRGLRRAGVNVCLGTDSLASVKTRRGQRIELNMFEEMRAMRKEFGELPPNDILRMATSNGARALGLGGNIGQLCERAVADLIVLPFEGAPKHVFESVLEHRGDVAASMIDGRWVTGRYANQDPIDGN
jgi:cytosine/adenosine deaminase-related metal-dependent hydrolase